MKVPWNTLLKIPAIFVETGLTVIDSGTRAIRTGVESLAGARPLVLPNSPPVNGPRDLDTALAHFGNQLIRKGWINSREALSSRKLIDSVLESARRSFGNLDFRDPRLLALPFELPFAAGGILAEGLLRLMAVYSVVGPKRLPGFLHNAAEVYVETAIFLGLEYKELIERYKEQLAKNPDDAETRLELGRIYIKCGRNDDAARELALAGRNPKTLGRAMHESAIAHYRAGRLEEAVRDGSAALAANPANERARVCLWLSAKSNGGYPASVPAEHRMEMKTGYAPSRVRFENIAKKIGMDKVCAGRGTAVFDYNNDGLPDIVIAAAHAGCTLYRNNGDGTFTDVSVGSGLDECINAFVVIAGDYDNDGFVDLFVTRQGFYYGDCALYHNNGDGTFTNVTEKAGVQNWGPAYTAHFVDYDNDGYLDLFIGNNLGGMMDRLRQNRLFHNNGDGTFTEVTEASGLHNNFTTIGSAWGDYNNDGYSDLFLSSGLGRPQLFRNNGDGTFTDVSIQAGFTDNAVATTCFWCDYDNDGWLDIVQYTWSDHEDAIYTMKNGRGPDDGSPLRVYHNNHDGTFTMLNREIGIDGCWGTMSGNFGDVNNDGFIDLLLGNGSPRMERLEPFILLESDGASFHDTTFAAGLPFFGKSHGVNCADLFGDGRMSILIASGGGYPGDLLPMMVHCPKELPGNYLNVRLRGTKSNRDAIGARITLISGDHRQMKEISHGTSFGCLPTEQHFGLGKGTKIDALEIQWPSGLRQRVENPAVNQTIRIVEGAPGYLIGRN